MRRPGSYELLFTPFSDDSNPPVRSITFPNAGSGVDAALAINTRVDGLQEEPPGPIGTNDPGNSTQNLRVTESNGFTTIVPLWDTSIGSQYDYNARLRSLRGYLAPSQMVLTKNNDPVGSDTVFRVRLELLPLEVSEAEAMLGGTLRSSTLPFISFSRAANRRRIWWRREWYMAANQGPFSYWVASPPDSGPVGFFEPRFSSTLGSWDVRLKNLMIVKRERWPVLAVSVQGIWPLNTTIAPVGFGEMKMLDTDVVCQLGITGELRAYLQK